MNSGQQSNIAGTSGRRGAAVAARLLGRDGRPHNEEAHAVRLNVLNSSVQEARDARSSRIIMWAITFISVPQILASIVVLSLKWHTREKLFSSACYRLQVWVLVQAIHMSVVLGVEWIVYYLNTCYTNRVIELREQYMRYLGNIKYGLDLLGVFWFLVGNMWVISDDDAQNGKPDAANGERQEDVAPLSPSHCDSSLYQLAFWMIVITYVKIFLPCILLLILLPVICFCLPCLIRVLSRFQDPMRGKGASHETIARLACTNYKQDMFARDDCNCCICLNDYVEEEELRLLPCRHHFHKQCADEWLIVNATCPTCRLSIYETASEDSEQQGYRLGSRNDIFQVV